VTGHSKRARVSLPRHTVDELMLAIDGCVREMERWDEMEDNREAARQAMEFAKRAVAEARWRVSTEERKRAEKNQA